MKDHQNTPPSVFRSMAKLGRNLKETKMNRLLLPALTAGSLIAAGSSNAATLVSSALDASQTDQSGSNGIFSGAPGGDLSSAVAGVTTFVMTNTAANGGKFGSGSTGPQTQTLRAVSLANGMDLTYDVTYSPFRFTGTDDPTSTRRGGYVSISSIGGGSNPSAGTTANQDREQTTANGDGVEFWRVVIDNVINSGSTNYLLDGAVTVRIDGLSGILISDTYVNGVAGTVLATAGTGTSVSGNTDVNLSSPATSFAIVATADDTTGPRASFENRWDGLAVQFTADQTSVIPEPVSLAAGLLGLGGLCLRRRRRV